MFCCPSILSISGQFVHRCLRVRPFLHHDPVGFGGQSGYYTDPETGLLLLGHRYYDPGTGKFINRDPIGYQGGANLYAFCGGNPVNEMDPEGTDAVEALNEIHKNRADIISIAEANHIQPQLLAGVVFAEVNAGGAPYYSYLRRNYGSTYAFAHRGRGDLGLTKVSQLASNHPELKTVSQRYAWAVKRNADTHLSLVEAADYLGHLARRRYGKKSVVLTPDQMSITLSEYNLGQKPIAGKHYPNKEGLAFLLGMGLYSGDDAIDTGLFGDEDEVDELKHRLGK
jgi:RHS repeat-associated protein